jgi:hypothetical protein
MYRSPSWSGKSLSLDVPTYVAGPFQPSQERYDSCRHTFASNVSQDYRAVCAQEMSNAHSNKKASNKSKKGNKRPGTESIARVLKKVCFKKHCNLCKKHGGTYTMHNTKDFCNYEKDGLEKAYFCIAKKGGKIVKPANNSVLQLSKKSEKLEKTIKK